MSLTESRSARTTVIRGTRIKVELILRKLAEGVTEAHLFDAYPSLTQAQIRAAITYAADVVAHEEQIEGPATPLRPTRAATSQWCARSEPAGLDVKAIVEIAPGSSDQALIELAVNDQRVLMTEDTDFGALVAAHAHASSGVILPCFPARARNELAAQVLRFLEQATEDARTAFIVRQSGRIRIGRTP